ncbi:MAG: DegV family EDD domain-containing protein [candidate division KSB1 bacterium]|nr:DegV family EDD domain-containing protein [candidate division KSB1 bacterium]MDZ7334616.1 DegV family EDD domain-containing protein [candidate division KSB1 bacterium]MDZ7356576.1 DegV family EDD domain-containing protein [candidate division KSB1 bacterium]MDZ7375946.1 DegV family EDD domain-containing protein [candidate division KSB1 bacterium]MDZ7399893.1 DegV family EDD domain-containing protein [candidate division KSB1 bacterium]
MKQSKITKHSQIRYLDGRRLRNAIFASTRQLAKMQAYLNKINVFPVPDGDTGTNMVRTMNHISGRLAERTDKSIAAVSSQMAESALMGAQGNSGAILAQFFFGFAEAVKDKWRLTTKAFAAAVQRAKKSAYEALSEPRDGTILTVISDWANSIEKAASRTEDFVILLKRGLKRARLSLAETPKKLDVLRKAGVVDAGAQGFVHFLEGIVHFIEQGKIEKDASVQFAKEAESVATIPGIVDSNISFRFCTEAMVSAEQIDHLKLKSALAPLGDSLIVAGSKDHVRVHIHTNSPDAVFETISAYGQISAKKVDDMIKQHKDIYSPVPTARIGIVTDSSCDLPHDFITKHHIHVIPMKISFGDQSYLDKVNITPMEFYDKLLTSPHHPTSSQPAMADVLKVYQQVVPQYDAILSIHLPRVVSGSFQTIERAAKIVAPEKITCIDGKGISAALGLVVMEAVAAIEAGLTLEQVKARVEYAIKNIRIFIMLPTLKYLVRGGRMSKPKGLIGTILGLKPIVTFDQDGRVILAGKAIGEKMAMKKTLKMASRFVGKYKRVKFVVAHANAYSKATWYVHQLTEWFDIKEPIPIVDAAPVLGVHSGPGTVGFAVLGFQQ